MDVKISVIIPSYKPEDYLWECLGSLYNQTYPKDQFEVILILNGCNEPYHQNIREYLNNHKSLQVHLIQTDNGGVSNARNIGLDNAKGEYISFIDDDDFVSPSYLEELLNLANEMTISLCYPLSFVDGTSQYEPYYITSVYEKYANVHNCHYTKARRFFAGPVYKLIHRDIIGVRRFDTSFSNGEDSIYMFLISDRYCNVAFTSKQAVYYRRLREGSAETRRKSKKKIIANGVKMIWALTQIYFGRPLSYSFQFYFGKVGGSVHWILEQIKNNR